MSDTEEKVVEKPITEFEEMKKKGLDKTKMDFVAQQEGYYPAGHQDTIVYYRDEQSKWRWRRRASNGEIVGASTEGYERFQQCRLNHLRNLVQTNLIDVE